MRFKTWTLAADPLAAISQGSGQLGFPAPVRPWLVCLQLWRSPHEQTIPVVDCRKCGGAGGGTGGRLRTRERHRQRAVAPGTGFEARAANAAPTAVPGSDARAPGRDGHHGCVDPSTHPLIQYAP